MEPTIDEIVQQVSGYWPGVDRELLVRAYDVAEKAHHGQLRKSGEPYIIHPLNVGAILAGIQTDPPPSLPVFSTIPSRIPPSPWTISSRSSTRPSRGW